MLEFLQHNWWVLVVRGAAALVLGVLALVWPGITLGALVLLWGVYAIVDGITALASAIGGADRSGGHRVLLALQGLLGLAAGVVAFAWPGLTAVVLLVLIGAWALVIGALQVVAAVRLRKEITNEWLLGAAGVVTVLFGLLLLLRPAAGALAFVTALGIWAIIEGIALIALAFRLRSISSSHAATPAH